MGALPELEAHYTQGSFSISNWDGYPTSGDIPTPVGPFRLLQGQEYDDARTLADNTNRAIRNRLPPSVKDGYDVHEIHPIKFPRRI
jgi:filamentous hemagglutinin